MRTDDIRRTAQGLVLPREAHAPMTTAQAEAALPALLAAVRHLGIRREDVSARQVPLLAPGQGWYLGGNVRTDATPLCQLARVTQVVPRLVAPHVPDLLRQDGELAIGLLPGGWVEPEDEFIRMFVLAGDLFGFPQTRGRA